MLIAYQMLARWAMAMVAGLSLGLISQSADAKEWISDYWEEPIQHQVIHYRIRAERLQQSATAAKYRLRLERRVEVRQLKLKFIIYIRTTPGTLISKSRRSSRQLVGPMPSRCSVCVQHKGQWFDDMRRRWKHHFNWRTGKLIRRGPWKPSGQPVFIKGKKGLLGIQRQRLAKGIYELRLRPVKQTLLKPKAGGRRIVEVLNILLPPSPEDFYWTKAQAASLALRIPLWHLRVGH